MSIWLSGLLIWMIASLPFAYIVARIIHHGSVDDE